MSSRLTAVAVCAAVLWPLQAHAADPADELRDVRRQLDDLKAAYEARVQALEAKVQALQSRLEATPSAASSAARADAQPAPSPVPAAAAPPPAPPVAAAEPSPGNAGAGGIAAFNPAISLILNGTYANLSQDPTRYRLQGFVPIGGEVGAPPRSFSLGESELGIAANVDPTFSGRLTASITPDDRIAVEEALFERQGLFEGATLRAGRFLSTIGYLNSQHAHAWDFTDAPLVYQAFFGGQLQTDGVHLHWIAPTERYVELGLELGAGRSFPGSDSNRNGIGSTALIAHLGDDIGESTSWRTGVSWVATRAAQRTYSDVNAAGAAVTNAFDGDSRTWVVDGILKWAPGGNATRTNFKLQGEYLHRTETGTLTYDLAGAAAAGGYHSSQDGWYVQAVYQFMPQWRVGLRYDRLDSGTPSIGLVDSGALTPADFPILLSARPSRTTAMVDWSLSEFSRFRLQLAADRSNPAATDRQLFLQYIMSLGAHGAHTF
jgi:hypothetical protein